MSETEAMLVDWPDVSRRKREGWRVSERDVKERRVGHDHGVIMVREVETLGPGPLSERPLSLRVLRGRA